MARAAKLIVAVAAAIWLSACGTVLPSDGKTATAEKHPGKSLVYVFNTYKGLYVDADDLVLDGETIGALSGSDYTWFYVEPGRHMISINDASVEGRLLWAREIELEPGQAYYLAYDGARGHRDADLLFDAIRVASGAKQAIPPDDLRAINEETARYFMADSDLVGTVYD